MTQATLSPISALVAHIESFLTDRRVLIVGDAERSLAEHVLERGARLVQVLDPDPKRVAQAAAQNTERRVTFAQLTSSSLRDGSYDCAIVEDAGIAADLGELARGVRKSMSSRGVALFCASNPDVSTGLLGVGPGSVDYDDLVEATEETFDEVIMLGQSPFLGYSVGQLDLDQLPEPALDNEYLSEGENPDFYAALCGPTGTLSETRLEELTIVQLPAARFVRDSQQLHKDKERRAARRVENLEKEITTLRREQDSSEVERLTAELEKRDGWVRDLEARAEAADARSEDFQTEVEELEKELEETHKAFLKASKGTSGSEKLQTELASLKSAHDKLTQEVQTLRTDSSRLKKDLDAEKRASTDARREATEARQSAKHGLDAVNEAKHQSVGRAALEEELTTLDAQKTSLENQLKEKQRAQERLEKRLAEQEKEIDDLHDQLDELEEQRAKDSAGPTQNEIERDLRALEDQLQKRGRRISELEGQLAQLETYAKTLTAELALKENDFSEEPSAADERLALARALAEREADLVAAQWTIGKLKQAAENS